MSQGTHYFVRVQNSLIGDAHESLDEAKKAAQGFLLSRSREKRAEVVPYVPGAFGGVGAIVAQAIKNNKGKIIWREA